MINKKMSRIIGPVLGIIFAIGLLDTPVLADDNIQTNYGNTNSTTSAAVMYKDYSININKSSEQNGIKVTIDKVIATKHKLKVVVKVESEKPFDKIKNDHSIVEVTFGENNYNSVGSSNDYIDDKTMVLTIEQENDEEEFPEKGELRVDVVFPNYKVNVGIDATVDFTESFKKTIEKDISIKIPEYDFTLNKLETSILGTRLIYSKNEKNYSHKNNNYSQLHHSSMILKVGNKMYQTRPSGSYSSMNEENERITTGAYEAEAATFDRAKDQKDMSIIPVVCDMNRDEIEKVYADNNKNGAYTQKNPNNETINNVSYIKSFELSNGSKGEIYKIERTDNTVKVYCRGNSEKESLVMASNTAMYYHFEEGKDNYIHYDSNRYMSFYKDSNNALGYVVEFNNVEKDKAVDLNLDYMIKQIDRYKVGDEIEISK